MIVWLAAGEGLPDAQRAYCAGGRDEARTKDREGLV